MKTWSFVSAIDCCITNFLKIQWLKAVTNELFIYIRFSTCAEPSRECLSLLRVGELRWLLHLPGTSTWIAGWVTPCLSILFFSKAALSSWGLSPACECSSWLGYLPNIGNYSKIQNQKSHKVTFTIVYGSKKVTGPAWS